MKSAFLTSWDPIYRGRTQRGMATGLAATGGRWWPRRAGGYLLMRGTDVDSIDQVVGTAGASATTITEFAWAPRAISATCWYQVVPFGPGGVPAVVPDTGDQLVRVRTGDAGDAEEPAPAAPRELRVQALAGGKFRVAWQAGHEARRATAAEFEIYTDAGTGTMDWDTPVDTVTGGGLRPYSWASDPYTHGLTVQFGVRAVAASGATELNTETASAVADAEGPAAAAAIAAVIGEHE